MEGDKRFAHIATDPKFRRIPKGERKVKIDKRFKSMFSDKKFKVKYTIDKRGRPVTHSTTEDLKRYYDLESESDEDDDKSDGNDAASSSPDELSDKKTKKTKETKQEEDGDEPDNDANEKDDLEKADLSDKKVPEKLKKKLKNLTIDYARGEGNLLSDSSSSDDESEEEDVNAVDEGVDHKWGELDADAVRTDDATYRLAACNMDWDRIRAVDLMVLFNSFLPPGGSIKSVFIYPSEFGKKRMAEEDIKGPAELVNAKPDGDNHDEEQEEGNRYHMEKLRQYQLNRLKYFYAVITCDGASTANKIYSECDGMEYESSATKMDLRFIPDDLSFDEDTPKETCNEAPDVHKYKPRFFTTTALQQAKVDLTWDETNPDRIEMAQKLASGKIDDIAEGDLHAYLASSSGEESEEEEANEDEENETHGKAKNSIDKYKLLLKDILDKEKSKEKKDIGMEISWGIDLQKKTEKLMKEKKTAGEQKTPFEELLEKRKEKRKEKRAAKKVADSGEDNSEDESVPSDIDMNDPYFAEEFNNPEFKSATKKKKSKKRNEEDDKDSISSENRAQLELLLDDEDDGKQHFSLKQIQDAENTSKKKKKMKKGKKGKANSADDTHVKSTDDFQVNVGDERFSALFTSHHYNIDPTDPHYKKTKNMEMLISEKIKRRTQHDGDDDASDVSKTKKIKLIDGEKKKGKGNAELNVLVKSVKRKAEAFAKKK